MAERRTCINYLELKTDFADEVFIKQEPNESLNSRNVKSAAAKQKRLQKNYRSINAIKFEQTDLKSENKNDVETVNFVSCDFTSDNVATNADVNNERFLVAEHIAELESDTFFEPVTAVFVNDTLNRTNRRNNILRRPECMNRFFCSYCSKSFYHNSELTKHVRTHTGEKPFKCEYCEKCFGRKTILNAHIRIHTGERPYKCPHCDKTFKDISNRTTHLRIHNSIKPYGCPYCGKKFYQKSNLIVHIRTHTGDRPYACNHCNRQFIQKPDLRKHIRIHTGEKPFNCDYCGKKFNDNGSRNNHVKIHLKAMNLLPS